MRKPKPYDYSDPRPPSRSQKKRDSTALQTLGAKLADLPESALKRLSVGPRLFEALLEYKHLTKHEARRRHLQFIGALMRDEDADPLFRAVEDMEAGNRSQAREFHELEAWRAAIMEGDDAVLEQALLLAPEDSRADLRTQARQLARNAKAEAARNKPPRSARALFRLLRQLKLGEGQLTPGDDGEDLAEDSVG